MCVMVKGRAEMSAYEDSENHRGTYLKDSEEFEIKEIQDPVCTLKRSLHRLGGEGLVPEVKS